MDVFVPCPESGTLGSERRPNEEHERDIYKASGIHNGPDIVRLRSGAISA